MMNKKAKTKKELLDEMTALQQELANFQSANAGLEKDKKALGKREKFLSGIFSSILEGITVLDPDLNILFVNPTMERWFPDVRPLIGKKCYQVYHGRDQVC
jgi:PAS domain-containing protein